MTFSPLLQVRQDFGLLPNHQLQSSPVYRWVEAYNLRIIKHRERRRIAAARVSVDPTRCGEKGGSPARHWGTYTSRKVAIPPNSGLWSGLRGGRGENRCDTAHASIGSTRPISDCSPPAPNTLALGRYLNARENAPPEKGAHEQSVCVCVRARAARNNGEMYERKSLDLSGDRAGIADRGRVRSWCRADISPWALSAGSSRFVHGDEWDVWWFVAEKMLIRWWRD